MTTDELRKLREVLGRVPTPALVAVRLAGRVYFRIRPSAAQDPAVAANAALVDGMVQQRRQLGR